MHSTAAEKCVKNGSGIWTGQKEKSMALPSFGCIFSRSALEKFAPVVTYIFFTLRFYHLAEWIWFYMEFGDLQPWGLGYVG